MVMLVVVVLKVMVLLSLHLGMMLVVFGLRKKKKREGFRRLVHAATAKYPGATSSFYQKMNVGRCNCCYR